MSIAKIHSKRAHKADKKPFQGSRSAKSQLRQPMRKEKETNDQNQVKLLLKFFFSYYYVFVNNFNRVSKMKFEFIQGNFSKSPLMNPI